jgi:hypothetical protein
VEVATGNHSGSDFEEARAARRDGSRGSMSA